jgi:hypothetical protein
MEYKHLWNLPMLPGFTDPANPNFEISEYFHRIQKSQCTTPPKMAEQQEYRTALTKWADDNGIKHPSCEYTHLFYSKEGYPYPGVIATKDIHPNEKIVEVPAHLTVTAYRAYQELKPIFDAHPDVFCQLPLNAYANLDVILIVTYLIVEQGKGEQSWLYNSLRLWQKEVNTMLAWDIKEIEELQDKETLEEMKTVKYIFEEFYQKFYSVVSKYDLFKKEFITKWYFFHLIESVRSREMSLGSLKIIPYLDLVNHSAVNCFVYEFDCKFMAEDYEISKLLHRKLYNSHEGYIFDSNNPYHWIQYTEEDRQPYCLYSNTDNIKQGSEIVYDYSYENIYLIKSYGFCMEYYIRDCIFISTTQMLGYPNKLAILLKLIPCEDPTDTSDLVIPVYYQSISNNLINYSKLLISKEEDFTVSKANIKLELAAIDVTIELIRNFINEHPTTLKQDMELLASKPKSYRMFMSVTCRAWRKRIGYHQIYLLEIVKEMLHKIENGESKKDSFDQPTKIEDGVNEFNLKLNRRMILSYIQLIK